MTSGEQVVEGKRETLQIRVSHIHEKVVDSNILEPDVGIVTDPLCAMHYINDGRYVLGDVVPELEGMRNVCKFNVKFYQTHSPDASYDSILTECQPTKLWET